MPQLYQLLEKSAPDCHVFFLSDSLNPLFCARVQNPGLQTNAGDVLAPLIELSGAIWHRAKTHKLLGTNGQLLPARASKNKPKKKR